MTISRYVYFIFGAIFLTIGAIGIFVPLLPTTPLVILAALCFGKSSKRAERWILSNRYFRTYIENYREKKGVPIDIKIKSITLLWIVLAISAYFTRNSYIPIVLLVVGIGVTAHIYFLKTQR